MQRRIPESEIERIKSEIDLAALVRAKGVMLKPHGTGDLVGRCPFHDDKTPSLVVTPKKGLWHCLGACQKGGSVIDWVMRTEGLSFRHAVAVLKEGKAASLLSSEKIMVHSRARRLECPLELDADGQALLNQVAAYYHDTLKAAPNVLEYLRRRGLENAEALATFKLGYADRTLGLRLPAGMRKDGLAIRERLQNLGVLRESGHEHLSGSLVIPIVGADGNVLGMYGRKVTPKLRPGTPDHLYLPGPHRGVFNPACLKEKEIILCEALLDALSFWVNGFQNVTTAYGVEGFTEEMLTAFIKSGVRRVFIAYDRDEAGDRAAHKLSAKLMGEGLECLRVLFPHGMDANEYIQKVKPADKALRLLLHGAEWMGKGKPVAVSAVVPPPGTVALPSGEQVNVETGEVLGTVPIVPAVTAPESSSLAASLPASPAATSPAAEASSAAAGPALPHTLQGEDVHVCLGERAYRVRGLSKNLSYEVLKVNLRVCVGPLFYLDTLEFYNAKARESFATHAAREVEVASDVLKRDMGRLLNFLEALQAERIPTALKPKEPTAVKLTAEEEAEALSVARAPDLPGRIVADLTACGYLGEDIQKLAAYLVAASRKLDDPLALIIQSSSASGKSSLMDAVLALVPPEDRLELSALTSQALFYMEKGALCRKVLSVAEDGGMLDAGYSIKNLITAGKLSKASPGKDPQTGKMVTQIYEVEGPAAVMVSSTASEIEAELKNRCLVVTLNEDREQTEAILQHQRFLETLEGKKHKKNREAIRRLHHNFQRLLRPLLVINPFARLLRFSAEQSRLRRDQTKYLGLMRTLALLHQHQRPIRHDDTLGEYMEVTLDDVAAAGRIATEVLGRTLDELAPQTRRLLNLLTAMVAGIASERAMDASQARLPRFEIRRYTRWGDTQLKIHLHRLVELEYLVVHRGSRGLFEYELLYRGEGEGGERFVLGLLGVEELRQKLNGHYDSARSAFLEVRSGSGRPLVGPRSEGGRDGQTPLSSNNGKRERGGNSEIPENAQKKEAPESYRSSPSYPRTNGVPAAPSAPKAPHKAVGGH